MNITVGPVTVSLIDQHDRIVGKVRAGKPFEPESLAVWAEWCAEGGQALDVGGYTGLYAIAAAKLGCTATVIEPLNILARRIWLNAAANGVSLNVVNAAASDREGLATIHVNASVFTSGASLTRKWPPKGKVRTVTIDGLGLDDVRAIKIDVEGHELNVLRGAAALIAKCRPHLLVETLGIDARRAVLEMFPAYRGVAFLDGRNLVLEPVS